CADRRKANRLFRSEGSCEQRLQRIARRGLPMAKKACSSQFLPEALAEQRSGEPVGGTRRIVGIENEDVWQHPLDSTRVDIGLVWNLSVSVEPAPVTDQKVAVSVL